MRTSLLALLLAASAQAAVSSNSATLTVNGNGIYDTLELNQFNTALGTLTGVSVRVNSLSIQGDFTATAGSGVTNAKVQRLTSEILLSDYNESPGFTTISVSYTQLPLPTNREGSNPVVGRTLTKKRK